MSIGLTSDVVVLSNAGPVVKTWAQVANPAALTALTDTAFNDGDVVRVACHRCGWTIDKSSSRTTDGITCVATSSGTGRWIRLNIDNDYFSTIAAYYVDEGAGSDVNAGTSSGAGALKTVAELMRRLKGVVLTQTIDVFIPAAGLTLLGQGGVPIEIDITARAIIGFTFISLNFRGTPTVLRSGTITSYAVPNAAGSNELSNFNDAGGVSTDQNKRVVNTTAGPRLGSSTFFGKNAPSTQGWSLGQARQTGDWGKSVFVNIFSAFTLAQPIVGDTFDVQTLPLFPLGSIVIRGGLGVGVAFDQLNVNVSSSLGELTTSAIPYGTIAFFNCQLSSAVNEFFGYVVMMNCTATGSVFARGILEQTAGIISTTGVSPTTPGDGIRVFPGGRYTSFLNAASDQSRGVSVFTGGWATLNGFGFFNGGSNVLTQRWGSHVNVDAGGTVEHRSLSGSVMLFGKFSTRTGVSMSPGGNFNTMAPASITLTGGNNFAGFDFEIDKVHTLQAWDQTLNAGVGGWTSPIAATWVNFNLAIAGGGLGGNARNVAASTSLTVQASYP